MFLSNLLESLNRRGNFQEEIVNCEREKIGNDENENFSINISLRLVLISERNFSFSKKKKKRSPNRLNNFFNGGGME